MQLDDICAIHQVSSCFPPAPRLQQTGRCAQALNEALAVAPTAQPSSAEEVSHEIARSNLSTFLTPSSIAAELRPDLDPVAAAAIYTGVGTHRAAVEAQPV
jgi:hypothetical protein